MVSPWLARRLSARHPGTHLTGHDRRLPPHAGLGRCLRLRLYLGVHGIMVGRGRVMVAGVLSSFALVGWATALGWAWLTRLRLVLVAVVLLGACTVGPATTRIGAINQCGVPVEVAFGESTLEPLGFTEIEIGGASVATSTSQSPAEVYAFVRPVGSDAHPVPKRVSDDEIDRDSDVAGTDWHVTVSDELCP